MLFFTVDFFMRHKNHLNNLDFKILINNLWTCEERPTRIRNRKKNEIKEGHN